MNDFNKNKMVEKIDITPPLSIYNIFQKLTYKHPSAISEFIDNSTQSYKDNRNIQRKIEPKIFLIHVEDKINNSEKIQIIDNCYGIKNSNLERVLKLNVPSKFTNKSRNEFGMGLKTAAFWLGNKLSILSKNINEDKTVRISMSLDKLESSNIEPKYFEGNYFKDKSKIFDFGTLIQISEITKKFTPTKLKSICEILASKYREDIINDKLEIRVVKLKINKNSEREFFDVTRVNEDIANNKENFYKIKSIFEAIPIEFREPKIRQDKNGNEYKIEIDDYLFFEDQKYHIKGWIGILETGNRKKAGLILFRYGRTIIGDDESGGYRPKKIFKDGASFEYQRLYGKIYLDDFPVVQAKNDFDWHSGLEEEFIDFLYKKLTEKKDFNLVQISRNLRNSKSSLEKKEIINNEVAKDIEEKIKEDNVFEDFTFIKKEDNEGFEYSIEEKNGTKYYFDLIILRGSETQERDWLLIKPKEKNSYTLELNLDLPFFSPFNDDIENVKNQIIRFCVYFSFAEIKHNLLCDNPSHFRDQLNKCIKKHLKIEGKEK
ncbi:MAG: ATP-binding protein [Malacoplasma sp.]|nr:ATP-binding protein [Malacoplasma sp.]